MSKHLIHHFIRQGILSILVILFCLTAYAQPPRKPRNNALSFEIGKTGLIYNLAFDHKFKNKNLGARLFVGSNFAQNLSALTTGGGGYYLVGNKTSALELGLDLAYLKVDEVSDDQKGLALVYPNYSIKTYYASLNIGFRKYGAKSLFRIGVSPGFIKHEFVPGGYISYGLSFF